MGGNSEENEGGDWQSHMGQADSTLINLSTRGLQFAKNWIDFTGGPDSRSLLTRMGDRVFSLAVGRAMELMGEHFVPGKTIIGTHYGIWGVASVALIVMMGVL